MQPAQPANLADLPGAEICRRVGTLSDLYGSGDSFAAGRLEQALELVKRALGCGQLS